MNLTKILAASLAAAVLCLPALAQEQGDRPERDRRQQRDRMSPEDAKAVWQLQAEGVAKGLGLSAETKDQLVKTYVQARQEAGDAMRGAGRGGRGGAGGQGQAQGQGQGQGQGQARGGRGDFGRFAEQLEEQRQALGKALSAFLSDEQMTKAMPALGSFNRSWDSMVYAVKQLGLDDAKTFAALEPIQQYIVTAGKARESGDRESMREAMMSARSSLEEGLGKVLDEEQMDRFTEMTSRGRGGRGGAGGGGGAARLMQYDANGDGKIQRSELPEGEGLEVIFDRLDANGDGVLEMDELRTGRGGRGAGGGGQDF